MKRNLILSVIVGACFTIIGVQTVKPASPKAPSAKEVFFLNRFKQIDNLMLQAVASEALPSAVCYVSYNGKPIYYKAFGYADREIGTSLKKNAIFRNATQTKLVTTVALMALYEKGLFKLEDPIKKFLPEFSHPMVYVSGSVAENNMVTRPAYGDITIRQLLSMTSGIAYDVYDQDLNPINYLEQLTTQEVVKRIAKLPLKHDPGEGFTDGFSLDVAGRLAEVVSGQRLDSLIRKEVLSPLGMKDTYFYLPLKKVNRLVPIYQKPDSDLPATNSTDSLIRFYPFAQNQLYFGGGAGLSGTIEDYAKLCEMIMNFGKIGKKPFLSWKTIEQMCTDQIFGVEGDYLFGLGLHIATTEDFARTMRNPGSLSWEGDFGTNYMIDPQNKLVVLLYTNKANWNMNQDVWGDLLRSVYMSLK